MRFTARVAVKVGQHATQPELGPQRAPELWPDLPCPFCHGKLFKWPACHARILSDAEPGQEVLAVRVPPDVMPVACPACDLVLFTRREAA